ncbi:MAG: DUF1501 domain-containing protein, partial [Pirellulaceae bacterium]|nr:DUF1501 domain-containing protein [Pirellulaceae bacterium]
MALPPQQTDTARRRFLAAGACGIGSLALGELLSGDSAAAAGWNPYAVREPHHPPTAKRVIFLFMAGAPSQLDLFTPKPKLRELHGKPVPTSYVETLDDALIRGSARVFASPRKFSRHGDCGMTFSDYVPTMASCADRWTMVRSMVSSVSNHHPAQLLMNCGAPTFGLPSMGSWVTYGLGSQSQNLPAFAVMLSRNGPGDLGGQALWDSAILPAAYRGVTFRSQGEPILHLTNPRGVSDAVQRARLNTVIELNRARAKRQPDPANDSRIAAYELAFRMQMAAPELTDLTRESKRTLADYGVGGEKSDTFGRNCLMARRMVERGVRFVQLYHYTWDDHSNLN